MASDLIAFQGSHLVGQGEIAAHQVVLFLRAGAVVEEMADLVEPAVGQVAPLPADEVVVEGGGGARDGIVGAGVAQPEEGAAYCAEDEQESGDGDGGPKHGGG